MTKQIMPAGYYYVGDPCYVVADSKWPSFVDETFKHEPNKFTFQGYPCWVHGTYFGDGEYYDDFNNSYGVDSGIIGVVEIGVFMFDIEPQDITDGRIVEFKEPFEVSYGDGVFSVGHFQIDTKCDNEGDFF